MMVTPVVVGLMWSYILDPLFGIANYILSVLMRFLTATRFRSGKPWVAVSAVKAWKTTRSTNHTINGDLHILSAPCSRADLLAYFSAHL